MPSLVKTGRILNQIRNNLDFILLMEYIIFLDRSRFSMHMLWGYFFGTSGPIADVLSEVSSIIITEPPTPPVTNTTRHYRHHPLLTPPTTTDTIRYRDPPPLPTPYATDTTNQP